MKIEVYDIRHIINQIKSASPPSSKEDHKLLNNLNILLEKNTVKKESPLETVLNDNLEEMNEKFLDMCFTRKDLVKKFSQEYGEVINDLIKKIEQNDETLNKTRNYNTKIIEWNLNTGCDDACALIPEIFGKLKKAKEIIEEAVENNKSSSQIEADNYLETCMSSI